jgi:tellurite resistance protein TehA-like permease
MKILQDQITKEKIGNVPVAITGISLGFITLGGVWANLGATSIRVFASIFTFIAIIIMFSKIILHPKKVYEEMKHCVVGSFYPTMAMALIVFSTFVYDIINPTLGRGIWFFGIILYIVLSTIFIIARLKNFKLEEMVPSWFVPTVGIGVAAVTSGSMNFPDLSKNIFYYAFIVYIIMLIVMIYRMLVVEEIPENKKITIAIMAAPASLCLAGLFPVFNEPPTIFIYVLVPLSLLSTLYVYTLIPNLIKVPFHPGLAPLTFPLAIGTLAVQKYYKYLMNINLNLSNLVNQIFYIELFISTIVIGYIVYKLLEVLFIALLKSTN